MQYRPLDYQPQPGEVPLVEMEDFLATEEALVELDSCVCDFVVKPNEGTVLLRQRSGEFGTGRRLVRPKRDGEAFGADLFDLAIMPRLNFAEDLPENVARAPNPARGGWREKVKNGFIAGVTQSVSTMFCYGIQHAVAEAALEAIAEKWTDLGERDLIEESADTAVTIAHMAAGHFVGTFHLAAYRAIGPWLNRCLAQNSFQPLGEDNAAAVEGRRLHVVGAKMNETVCAYAVHEHIIAHADEDSLLTLAANVMGWSGSFLNGLIMYSVNSAVADEKVLSAKSLDQRLEALKQAFKSQLEAPGDVGLLPSADVLVGLMLADVGGLLFTRFADEKLMEAAWATVGSEEREAGAVPVVGIELLLAAWLLAVKPVIES